MNLLFVFRGRGALFESFGRFSSHVVLWAKTNGRDPKVESSQLLGNPKGYVQVFGGVNGFTEGRVLQKDDVRWLSVLNSSAVQQHKAEQNKKNVRENRLLDSGFIIKKSVFLLTESERKQKIVPVSGSAGDIGHKGRRCPVRCPGQ